MNAEKIEQAGKAGGAGGASSTGQTAKVDEAGGARSVPDTELVRRTLDGDQEAYRALVSAYQNKVYGIAYGVIRNREDALDIAQEVFIKAFKKLRGFRGSSSFYTWIYRITINMAIDHARKKKHMVSVDYDEAILEVPSTDAGLQRPHVADPLESLERTELNETIMNAIMELPEEQRATVVLREIEDLSYAEIAAVLGCSIGTVMSRLHYGRKKLRQRLSGYLSAERGV
ncbi:MAG: sigma-70 family RNA polymerase sigma factor [Verrucomicrobia bacterium]|nr:sigma-70 family RNA polymerase sigma factor [Verrucomicrobiota bacterium]